MWKGIAWRVPLQTGPEGWDLSGERCAVAAWQSWGSLPRHLSTHLSPCPGLSPEGSLVLRERA